METLIIDKYKKIILFDDCLFYLREDVVSEEFKEQHYPYKDIEKVGLSPKEYFWGQFWFSLSFDVLFDGNSTNLNGERERLKLVFENGKFRYLDLGSMLLEEKKHVKDRILEYVRNWHKLDSEVKTD